MALALHHRRPTAAAAACGLHIPHQRAAAGRPCLPPVGRPAFSLTKQACASLADRSFHSRALPSDRRAAAEQRPIAASAPLPTLRPAHAVRRRLVRCRSSAIQVSELPDGLRIEAKSPDSTDSEVEYDEVNKVVRVPLVKAGGRTKLVLFTCNKCGGRTARLVNPVAWEKGVVFGQCSHCKVWHVLASNDPKIYEEIVYKDDPRYNGQLEAEQQQQQLEQQQQQAALKQEPEQQEQEDGKKGQ